MTRGHVTLEANAVTVVFMKIYILQAHMMQLVCNRAGEKTSLSATSPDIIETRVRVYCIVCVF